MFSAIQNQSRYCYAYLHFVLMSFNFRYPLRQTTISYGRLTEDTDEIQSEAGGFES